MAQRSIGDSVRNELSQVHFIGMLQLAPAAISKMLARRRGVMGTMLKAAIGQDLVASDGAGYMPPVSRDAITARSDAYNL